MKNDPPSFAKTSVPSQQHYATMSSVSLPLSSTNVRAMSGTPVSEGIESVGEADDDQIIRISNVRKFVKMKQANKFKNVS